MIKSMTGYGKSVVETDTGRTIVEIRSVNHRYGEVYVKMPRTLLAFENDVRKAVGDRLKRGKIEVFVQREEAVGGENLPSVNIPLAKAYRDAFEQLKRELDLADPVTLPLILSQRDVLSAREEDGNEDALRGELLGAVRGAVEAMEAMRLREGEALFADLTARRRTLSDIIERIALRAPAMVAEYAARLRERLTQLLSGTTLDETRFAQEVALMADRSDITEELVRFRSHLVQFDDTLKLSEPVGRKLDFLMQEFNREVNTIGSKAGDADTAALVVELKAELEKIREQVQNIE
ncbi:MULTISPECIES: YicC/YloC family endoribonuclease [Geobacter]|uniref:YicC/YloC family endoribonuclease n=1 Tax=Geobacter TaxID=28231 RepID=UPI0025736390|nr:YicC/YloC family endoribonuclease [Geobacter sulfurreducens]BEH09777.1 YicC family protein [Geobacter sulfurreducens subsp. ethanolicus]BET57672.1 YicC family protein [Geobacter sp. 60473]